VPVGDQLPQVLGGGDPAREAAGHADDGDRLVVAAVVRTAPVRAGVDRAGQLPDELCDRALGVG
jgi:hypothetical protein